MKTPKTRQTPKSTKPPLRRRVDLSKLDEFAAEGLSIPSPPASPIEPSPVDEVVRHEKAKAPKTTREPYPWEDPALRKDYFKGMGVPLSEPYIAKLRFIAQNTMWSQRKFCIKKLEEAIDREIARIKKALEQENSLT